jgi:hypothetical protein
MYKIIDKTGRQIGKEIDDLKDALVKIRRFRRSGARVVVVDTGTRIISKRNPKGIKQRKDLRPCHFPH